METTTEENKVLDNDTRKLLAETGMLGFTENPEFIYTPTAFRKKYGDTTDDVLDLPAKKWPEGVSEDDYIIPKEHWPIFKLRAKDGIETAKMEDNMGHMEYDDKTNIRRWIGKSGTHRVQLLKDGIKGWKNFYNVKGELIPFRENNGTIHNDSLKLINIQLASELSNAIMDHTALTSEELEGLEY